MPRRQGGSLSGFTPLSTPNAPTDLSVSTSIGSASVSFTAPTDTGDGAITSYIVTAVNESTGESTGATGSASPITVSPGGGTFKIRAQAVNGFGPGRLTEFSTGNALFSGAELYAWGINLSGALGDNSVVYASSPVQIGALTTWKTSSAGRYRSGAIKTDGTLWTWGSNGQGQLGLNDTAARSSPVQVGALTNWSTFSLNNNALAVKTDGTLWSWGSGNYGRNGQGNTTNYSSPVQVGALTGWSSVSAGFYHAVALKTNGTLWAWGFNGNGQVGDNTIASRSSPVQVGLDTTWSKISGGPRHTAAIKINNTLWVWGRNNLGQLGQNDIVDRSSPVQVGALTNWSEVATSGTGSPNASVTLAVKTDGTLWSWGYNGNGSLGQNSVTNCSSPIQVGALTNWSTVFGGDRFAGAIKTDGTLWAWGAPPRVGDNTTTYRSSPVQIGALTNWASVGITCGSAQTIALLGVV